MFTEAIKKRLDEKIPREAVAQREGGGKTKLSYLEGWYVIDRLNAIFGQGNWQYGIDELKLVYQGEVAGQYGSKHCCSYVAQVRLEVRQPTQMKEKEPDVFSYSNWVSFTEVGYGDGSDKSNPGKAHELAVKEAVTDGVKRAAKNLGMSMGLALYDKTQENVSDEDEEVVEAKPAPKAASAAPSKDSLISLISTQVTVLTGLKKVTKQSVQEHYKKTYNVASIKDLNVEQLQELTSYLQTMEK